MLAQLIQIRSTLNEAIHNSNHSMTFYYYYRNIVVKCTEHTVTTISNSEHMVESVIGVYPMLF